jgi:hypothetical protein
LDVLLDPDYLVRVRYGLTAAGHEAAGDEGCHKPG